MIIAVGDIKVYKFPNSTIACEVHYGYTELLVTPEQRRFVVLHKPDRMQRLQDAYPEQTHQSIATTLIVNALRNGFIQADEEIIQHASTTRTKCVPIHPQNPSEPDKS